MSQPGPHTRHLRKGRCSICGNYYFVTTSVGGRRDIFRSAFRAGVVLDALTWLTTNKRFYVDAAVVMPDHLHIAGQLGEITLATVMHSLKSYTSNQLSKSGVMPPVWQSTYHDHMLRDDEDYRIRVRYLLENPVRAGLVSRIEDYPHLILPKWWQPEGKK